MQNTSIYKFKTIKNNIIKCVKDILCFSFKIYCTFLVDCSRLRVIITTIMPTADIYKSVYDTIRSVNKR